jgi:hypothetical protein
MKNSIIRPSYNTQFINLLIFINWFSSLFYKTILSTNFSLFYKAVLSTNFSLFYKTILSTNFSLFYKAVLSTNFSLFYKAVLSTNFSLFYKEDLGITFSELIPAIDNNCFPVFRLLYFFCAEYRSLASWSTVTAVSRLFQPITFTCFLSKFL